MRRSERVARVYVSCVMFAETFVIISFRPLDHWPLWTWLMLFIGSGALLLPLAAVRPTRFLRTATSVVAVLLATVWAWAAWPIGTVAWLAWAALVWFSTLPGPDGHTPQEHERLDTTTQDVQPPA